MRIGDRVDSVEQRGLVFLWIHVLPCLYHAYFSGRPGGGGEDWS